MWSQTRLVRGLAVHVDATHGFHQYVYVADPTHRGRLSNRNSTHLWPLFQAGSSPADPTLETHPGGVPGSDVLLGQLFDGVLNSREVSWEVVFRERL